MAWANMLQDRPRNQIGRGYIHFDDSLFAEAEAYIAAERARVFTALSQGRRRAALRAFGRLLHTRQDFYSHSTWLHDWGATVPDLATQPADAVPLCLDSRNYPNLISGNGGLVWFVLWRLPLFGRWIKANYPPAPDTHEVLNLDGPERGPLFAFSYNAALRHTVVEWELVRDAFLAEG